MLHTDLYVSLAASSLVLHCLVLFPEFLVDKWRSSPVERRRLSVAEPDHHKESNDDFKNKEHQIDNIHGLFVWVLLSGGIGHYYEHQTEKSRLQEESDQLWETLVDVALVSEVNTETLSEAVEASESEAENWWELLASNH